MSKIAIIGTAGRDKTKPMTKALWTWMLNDINQRIGPGDHLVSGGAAWADHLAVALFLSGRVRQLTLHLPAPLNDDGRFEGPFKSPGSTANYYHDRFSQVIGSNSRYELMCVSEMDGCTGTFEPAAHGYAGMFNRNRKIAEEADLMYAYTFGTGGEPAQGGTKHTWDMCKGKRIHISLPYLP